MSMITENTIVIRKSDEKNLMADYRKYGRDYRMGDSLNKVFSNDDISVFVFDADGDSPWETEDTMAEYIALETNYLTSDEDLIWTRIDGVDSDMTIDEWLCGILPEEDYKKVSKLISYSSNYCAEE